MSDTVKASDVFAAGEIIRIHTPDPLPDPYSKFTEPWKEWVIAMRMVLIPVYSTSTMGHRGSSILGYKFHDKDIPEGIKHECSLWIPLDWAKKDSPIEISNTTSAKKLCDCPSEKVIWFGCKEHR